MRARIQKPAYRLEYEGPNTLWNVFLRPILGGPEAPPDPVAPAPVASVVQAGPAAPAPVVRTYAPPVATAAPAAYAAPAAPSGTRTWYPPREPREPREARGPRQAYPDTYEAAPAEDDRPAWRRRGGPEPEARVEASSDPKVLYERLGALGSRRSEKDAVLAAVWFVGKGEKEVHEKEIEAHFAEHGGPTDVNVRPVALKHINRTKLLEQGSAVGLVRLSAKGREQIRLLCGV
jgi:hypothetical protein